MKEIIDKGDLKVIKVGRNTDMVNLILSILHYILNNDHIGISAIGKESTYCLCVAISMVNTILSDSNKLFNFFPKFEIISDNKDKKKTCVTVYTKEIINFKKEKINNKKVIKVKNDSDNAKLSSIINFSLEENDNIKLRALGKDAIVNEITTLCYLNMFEDIQKLNLIYLPKLSIVKDNKNEYKGCIEWDVLKL